MTPLAFCSTRALKTFSGAVFSNKIVFKISLYSQISEFNISLI